MWPLLLLLALPIVEIALFVQVGGAIGLWPTLALVILAAVGGASLIRVQGLETIRKLQASLETGADPAGPLADGALTFVAGILLLIPGFLTDIFGLILLIPGARRLVIRQAARRVRAGHLAFVRTRSQSAARTQPDTVDAEYEVLDDVPPSERGASGWTRPQR